MKKKKYQDEEHFLDKNSRLDSMKYPELDGSDTVWEQHKRIKLGFFHANILSQLRPRAVKLYDVILCCTNRKQSTYAGNKKLSELSQLSELRIGKKKYSYLNELEYWHLIKRYLKPNRWDKRKKDRTIVVLRWDTAREKLLGEGKITKEGIARPNPFSGLPKKTK
ncbi:hypothetical protein ES695_03295 [Candidatus Atribacteria bacterium 1244-E10-H5-B2]|nr:MAG: hypothetical protein ES695_03295 [Candidatus Atribacteria bacterium 1244-E10-H5-B2]